MLEARARGVWKGLICGTRCWTMRFGNLQLIVKLRDRLSTRNGLPQSAKETTRPIRSFREKRAPSSVLSRLARNGGNDGPLDPHSEGHDKLH